MDSASTNAMRAKCFKAGVKMLVVKNTLLYKALEAAEVDFSI
jgi:large subunit ribosomal protein L10